MVNFTAALQVLNTDWHVTLCFAPCVRGKKVETSFHFGGATVLNVVYWEHCDLTVALVKCYLAEDRAKYWAQRGYGYTLGFVPHFTLGKGNVVNKHQYLIGKTFTLGHEYCRVY